MRSGSPANDGSGWSSAQHPHSDETLGSQGRYGSGARSEPQDAPGSGRREAPFGPEISWPYGFRKLDPESREVLESAYGTSPAYQQPAMDDFGYGDPGYSDPSYEGPKAPYGNSVFPPGNGNGHGRRDFGGTGRRPSGGGVPGYHVRDPAAPGRYQPQSFSPPPGQGGPGDLGGGQPPTTSGGLRGIVPPGGNTAYPEEWYDNPHLDDRALGDLRPSRSADPRLVGMTYGELRYDEPAPGESGYVEPLDDESWYQELRRSAPAYPETPGGPQGPGSGPQRRAEPSGPGFGQQSGYAPAPDRSRLRPAPPGRIGPEGPAGSADERRAPPAGSGGSQRRLPQRAGRAGHVGRAGRPAHPAQRHPGRLPAGPRRPPGRARRPARAAGPRRRPRS